MLLMAACTSKSPSDQIASMQKRLSKAESRLEVLYNDDFNFLIGKCMALDTVLPLIVENEECLFLMKQYLQQFETTYPIMTDDISYSRQQLSNLGDDINAGILEAEKVTKYIADEEAALKRLEAQVDYFSERFDEQRKFARRFVK